MRLATINTPRGLRLHVRGRVGYVDVAEATGDPELSSLQVLLQRGPQALNSLGPLQQHDGDHYDLAQFGPTVPGPGLILCLGLNYREHALEGHGEVPRWPEVFMRAATTVLAPYADLVKPTLSSQFDYEGELGIVVGSGGRYISAETAMSAVAGFVVLNDASARDWQRAATQWEAGKNFDGTMPMGPELVTPDEVDVTDIKVTTALNGHIVQSARTSDMILDISSIIEFCSSFLTLQPGDVIATGTPAGVGFARQPPVWLQPEDLIEVSVEGIGTIRNKIVVEEDGPAHWRWMPKLKETPFL